MRIKIEQACLIHGKHCEVGNEMTVEDRVGRELIAMGRAVEAPGAKEKKKPGE